MIEYLIELDKSLLIWINSFHSPVWDKIMIMVTNRFFWIPLYVLLAILIIKEYKKQSILILILIGLLIGATDRISSGMIKPTVKRLRPCHDSSINSHIHMPNGCGGKYGYLSSHAANSFAIALFLFLIGSKKKKWFGLLFFWAIVVSYSRIYLGVHYPGDIISGGLLGIILAYLFYKLFKYIEFKYYSKNG